MIWFLVALSVFGMLVALILPGWSDLMFLAGPFALASIGLLLCAMIYGCSDKRSRSKSTIVVDGSNVLYWKDETPRIEAVREVVDHLSRRGLTVGVVFDANAGYLISDRYRHDREMGKMLGMSQARVLVVPKGTPADPYILAAARDLGARIVTNDRYRDWVEDHPEIRMPGHLITGGYRGQALWLDLEESGARRAASA
jgi:hypothetical protein